jgi:hypothetical protein
MLSFDFDLSRQNSDQKTQTIKRAEELIEIQRILLEMHSEFFGTENLSLEKKRQFAIYFEYLKTLPEELQERIISSSSSSSSSGGVDLRTALLDYTLPRQESTVPKDHQQILEELQRIVKVERVSRRIILEDEFRGLETGVFPMQLAVKDKKRGTILLFIELEGEMFNTALSTETTIEEKREHELKEKLYQFHYPGVPLKRIQLSFRPVKDFANEILEDIKQILKKKVPQS